MARAGDSPQGDTCFPAGEKRVQPPAWHSQEQQLECMPKRESLKEQPERDVFLHMVFGKAAAASAEDAGPGTDGAERHRGLR